MDSKSSPEPAYLIKYTNLKWTKAEVALEGSESPVYNVEYHLRKPNLRIFSPNSPDPFASVTFHCFANKIEMRLSSNDAVEMKPRKWYSCNYVYTSPNFGGQKMMWQMKSRFKSYDFFLLDEHSIPVAKMVSVAGLSVKKIGKLEFAEGFKGGEAEREEILMGALSLAYHAMQETLGAMAGS